MPAFWYGKSLQGQWNGTTNQVDWVGHTIKVALTTATYTPLQDTHQFFSDVTNEISGTGYSAGGVTLGTKSVTYDSTTNEARLLAANAQWTTATFTARYAVVYRSTGTSSTSQLICYVDFGSDQSVSSGTFTIAWDATGVAKVTAA